MKGLGLSAILLGFGLLPVLWFGGSRLPLGRSVWLVLLLAGPIPGYAILVWPFRRWTDLARNERLFAIGLSLLYWAIYTPLLFYWLTLSIR